MMAQCEEVVESSEGEEAEFDNDPECNVQMQREIAETLSKKS
jgi:hypothetical protein